MLVKMDYDEDIDLLSAKKSVPRQGRRSSKSFVSEGPEDNLNNISDESFGASAPRTRKTGVWGEDPPKSSKSKFGSNMIELERFRNDKPQDSDDDIPVIPDIDDLQDDPLNLPDVKPIVTVDKSTYKELDNQFDNFQTEQMNIGNLGDVDLSFLTGKLFPEKEIQPCMEIWTLESLFNDLSRSSGAI